jgi:hypothetical protein
MKRKTGRLHTRVDEDNRRLWEREARAQGMSLSAWLEALANREVLYRQRRRAFEQSYPGRRYEPRTDLGP